MSIKIKTNTALVRQRVFFECLIIAPIIHVDAYRLTCIYDNTNKINDLKYYIPSLAITLLPVEVQGSLTAGGATV